MVRYLGGGLSDILSMQKKKICSKNNVLLWECKRFDISWKCDVKTLDGRFSSAAKFTSKARTDLHMLLGSPALSIRE
jgi:hypothetical protein